MRLVKIGVASVNATVGAVRSNVDRCIRLATAMAEDDVTLAVFPEQVVGGYAAEDLVQWQAFVESQRRELERFAAETARLRTVFALGLTVGVEGDLFNVGALVHGGKILAFVPKEKLPTYNVFYESRVFSRGMPHMDREARGVFCGDRIFQFDFGIVAIEVCEDIWSPDGPMRRRAYSDAEIVCNLSASPFRAGIGGTRREMIATRAADNQCTIAYANLVGGNDGLVFDGGGFVNQNGRPMLEATRFREGYAATVVDLDRTVRSRREASTWRSDLETFRREQEPVPAQVVHEKTADRAKLRYPAPPPGTSFFLPSASLPAKTPRDELLDDFHDALALGVADYYRKIGAFRRIGLALSGGRDSLLTLLIAHRAAELLHPELEGAARREAAGKMISAFYMPSRYSSDATQNAAARICADLGVSFMVVPIEDAFVRELEATRTLLGPGGPEPTELTKQNVQARIRGQRMWNWSNTSGALFLQTGNMSEKALGYTTVGGDLEGAFSVIANLPKTVVIAMLERLEKRFGYPGIRATLETTAGPELAANQSGEAELMPFEVLDACLYLYGAEKLAPNEVALALTSVFPDRDPAILTAWAEKFARLFTQSIFKWVQSPLAIHLGSLDLDRERALQLPVVQRTEWKGE
ncbi:NAD(+) synthase [Polyangium jinanense]|uniref:NAD(+) synthase n=1 Tax=Polyangium jinanense TaxID=2829994 RepID=UPI00233FBC1A|nr:NAD(+) synthase [Polyangium jinanense]MDC3952609.1 NAD(+) synthase [Polyangium jinanense]